MLNFFSPVLSFFIIFFFSIVLFCLFVPKPLLQLSPFFLIFNGCGVFHCTTQKAPVSQCPSNTVTPFLWGFVVMQFGFVSVASHDNYLLAVLLFISNNINNSFSFYFPPFLLTPFFTSYIFPPSLPSCIFFLRPSLFPPSHRITYLSPVPLRFVPVGCLDLRGRESGSGWYIASLQHLSLS